MSGGLRPASPEEGAPEATVAGSSALLFVAQIVGNAGLFVALLVVARALGPSGRGTMAFMMVGAMILARLGMLGIDEATTVFAARRPTERGVLLANLMLFASTATLVLSAAVAAALWASGLAPAGIQAPELVVVVLAATATSLALSGFAYLVGLSRFRGLAAVTALQPWVYAAAVGAAWALTGLTVILAASLWTLAQLGWAAATLFLGWRRSGIARPRRSLLRESIDFGVRAWAGSIFRFLNSRFDQLLVVFLTSEATLGHYAVAVNAFEVILYLPAAVATVMLPLISRAAPDERTEYVLRIFRSVTLMTVLGIAAAALLGPVLVPLLFGSAFQASVPPFLLMLPGAVGFTALTIFVNALVGASSPGLGSFAALASLVVGLALDIALVPSLGADGAALASTAAYLVGGASAIIGFRRGHPFAVSSLAPRWADAIALGEAVRRLRPEGMAR